MSDMEPTLLFGVVKETTETDSFCGVGLLRCRSSVDMLGILAVVVDCAASARVVVVLLFVLNN